MQIKTNQVLIVFLSALGLYLLYKLAPILTPFLLGALIAYLAQPLVKILERKKINHLLAVCIVFFCIFGTIILIVLLLVPVIRAQINALIEVIPDALNWMQESLVPYIQQYVNIGTVKTTVTENISKAGPAVSALIASSYTVISAVIDIILTPIVTFYLLRDWELICDRIMKAVPKSKAATVRSLAHQCDEALGGFFRGQLIVMFALCLIYGLGLTLIGLKTGLVIGVIGGLLSIVPFLGSAFVLIVSLLAALVQFGTMKGLLLVFAVFLVGQGLEGYVLTPYFIGERIGLHSVVVIFAIMAGGTLFGFFGVLLALPVAAIAKVFINYSYQRYLKKQSA